MITETFARLGIDYSITVAVIAAMGFYAIRTCFIAFHEVFAADFVTSAVAWTKDTVAKRLFRADYGYIAKRGVSDVNNAFTVEFAQRIDRFCAVRVHRDQRRFRHRVRRLGDQRKPVASDPPDRGVHTGVPFADPSAGCRQGAVEGHGSSQRRVAVQPAPGLGRHQVHQSDPDPAVRWPS